MRTFLFKAFAFLFFFFYSFNVSAQTKIYVNSAAAGANSGLNWANAYIDLQTAITKSVAGNEIWVARGNYSPGALAASTFTLKGGVKIYGGFAGTETAITQRIADVNDLFTVNESILDGRYVNNHVLSNAAALNNQTVLDGFTITGGRTPNANSNAATHRGAGIYNTAGSPVFQNLWIKDNISSGYGGGIYNNGTASFKNLIVENNGFYPGLTSYTQGAGMYNSAAVVFDRILFNNNTGANSGGGLYNTATTTLSDATFKNHSVTINGGGIFNNGDMTLDRAAFLQNTAVQRGGGIYSSAAISLRNSALSRNAVTGTAAGYYGGGMYVAGGLTNILNCTFSNNTIAYPNATTAYFGGGLHAATTLSAYNSIFWGNKRGNDVEDQIGGTTITMGGSLVQNNYPFGTNNLIGNPDFENAGQDDLRLKNGSIAIDAGDNAKQTGSKDLAGNARLAGLKLDLGALENPDGMSASLTIAPENITPQPRGLLYRQELSATGGTGPVSWALTFGNLPPGITLNNQSGVLAGIPMIAGTYIFVVQAKSGALIGNRQYTIVVTAAAARLHVNGLAQGLNNGADWANSYTRLQTALALAKDGDEIWVAKGVYSPALHLDSAFSMVSGVKMYGGFKGIETTLAERAADASERFTVHETILHGNGTNRHLILNTTALAATTLLDGFTITEGYANGSGQNGHGAGIYIGTAVVNGTYNNLVIKSNKASIYGGGMFNGAAATKLNNILFEGNQVITTTRYGGGLYNSGANASLNKITFRNNDAVQGAGMFNSGTALTMNKIAFEGNTATSIGGGMSHSGTAVLTDAVFKNNTSKTNGAGLYSSGDITIDRASFLENVADQKGGGIYALNLITLRNVVLSKNSVTGTVAGYNGGGMFIESGTAHIQNSTFSNNTIAVVGAQGSALGAGLFNTPGTVNIHNSIFWGNKRGNNVDDQIGGAAIAQMGNNIVQNNYTSGVNNIIGNPDFQDAAIHDFRLKNGSIAIDAGNNLKVNTATDLAGNTRVVNGTVDLGALENPIGAPGSLTMMPESIAPLPRGTAYHQPFTLTGGSGAVSWELSHGTLPLGLNFNTQTGILSGIPVILGTYVFVIRATQGSMVGSRQYTLVVNPGAVRLYVRGNATGVNNGIDWTNAYTRLQTALTLAKDGDEIWVAKGRYLPFAHVDSSFYMVSGVKMYGGFAGTENQLTERIADASGRFTVHETELSGNDLNRHVINNPTLLSVETMMDGFTISGGNSNNYGGGIYHFAAAVNGTFRNLVLKNNKAYHYGGGIYNVATALKMDNILFEENVLIGGNKYGGGMHNSGANAILNKVTFRGNQAVLGAGLYNISANVSVTNSVFEANAATSYGGGLVNTALGFSLSGAEFISNRADGYGGGMANSGTAVVTDVVFKNNSALTYGGGLSNSSVINLDRVSFLGNTAVQNGAGFYGTVTNTLSNVVFSRNKVTNASYFGGGLFLQSGTLSMSNATFSNNTVARVAVNSGAGLYKNSGTANIFNSIFWGNTRAGGIPDQVNTGINTLANSTVQDDYATGTAIIVGDPLFTDADMDNLSLKSGSLAIDKGNNTYTESSKDIEGNPRFYNTIVDQGAYENQGGASLKISPATLSALTRGLDVNIQLHATGGTAPYTWSLLSGDLPTGLQLSADGRIYGRAMVSLIGGYTFAVSVADGTLLGTKQYTLEVLQAPARIYVREGATAGAKNGNSWNDAFTDLQLALAQTNAGDEVWVAKGNYLPGTDVNATFTLREGVKLYGGFAGTEDVLSARVADANQLYGVNESILNGNGKSYHVLSNITALSNATIIDGFSITGGRTAVGNTSIAYSAAGIYNNAGAAVFRNLWVKNNYAYYFAGGIYNNGPATFENIRMEKNTVLGGAGYGGGLYNLNALASFKKLVFIENEAVIGGGMYNSIAEVRMEDLSFLRNKTGTSGGAGLYHRTGLLTIKKAFFEGNNSSGTGGGILNNGVLDGEDLTFKGNTTTTSGAGVYSSGTFTLNRGSFIANSSLQHGAGVYNTGIARLDNIIFSRNTIPTNSASGYGAGMFHYSGSSVLSNVSFSNNTTAYIHATTTSGAGFFYRAVGTAAVYNSIFWGNKRGGNVPDQLSGVGLTVANSIVETGYAAGTNISIGNPLFTDAANDNLRIKGGSPAIDAGDNAATGTSRDLDVNERIVNDKVDLGAYENQGGSSLSILPATLPAVLRGKPFSQQFTATGGTEQLSWSVSSGNLPTGLSLSPSGLLAGRPTTAGSFTFVLSVTDGAFIGSKQYSFVISPAATHFFTSETATGKKDGSDWANAFTDLQSAIALATAGDEIWVAKGNYSPGPLAASSFTLKEGLRIYGGFSGTEENLAARNLESVNTINKSLLDGSQGVASYHVVSNVLALTNATILDGFVISGGKTLTTNSSSGYTANYYGAGIYTALGNPIFNNLIITGNSALYGGGVFVGGGAPTFTNTQFVSNTTIGSYGRGAGLFNNTGANTILDKAIFDSNVVTVGSNTYGGALINYGTLTITSSSFKNNNVGGTAYAQGGAIYNNTNAPLKVANTTFTANTAMTGGAIYLAGGASEFKDVIFKENKAAGSGGAVNSIGAPIFDRVSFIANESVLHGGALYSGGVPKLDNVIFSRNKVTSTAANYGGAMYAATNASLINVTFSNNSIARASAGGGGLYRAAGTVTVNNSIFWGNTYGANLPDQISGVVTIDKSIVQGGYAAGTNISIGNPLFVNADADNLRLKGGSPAIDMGNNAKISTATDLDGNPRLINETVDMGAYENQGAASLAISPLSLAAYNRGDDIEVPLTVAGAQNPLTWSFSSGTVPVGLILKPEGVLSGRPMIAGLYTFVIAVTDGELVGSRQYTLQVNPANAVLYTNIAASGGKNDGSNWENGFTDLKNALNKAIPGDQIWVAKGNYSPGLLATDWFTLKEGVKVFGGFGGTEKNLEERDSKLIHTDHKTILDGSQGVASRHVVFNNLNLSNTTLLDGFTINGGQALPGGDTDNNRGGGIYNYAGVKAVFNNLQIVNNKADRGAGVYNAGPATFSNILFEKNEASAYGGGMYNLNAAIGLTNAVFKENTARLYAGGLAHNGGLITINNSAFTGNSAGQQAGGMYHLAGTANLENVIFSRNSVSTTGAYYGGGMFVAAAATLNNVTFSANRIAFTQATTMGGAGLYRSTGVLNVNNSIFWGNKRGNEIPDQLNAGIVLTQSLVQGGYAAGTNVLIGDPLFNNAAGDDLQLKAGSPAIDAGDNSKNSSSTDLLGNARVMNDLIDLGAYENQGGAGLKILPGTFNPFPRGIDPVIQMTATGGTGTYTWTLQSGSLPTGLILTQQGLITGMPVLAGTYTFVAAATDGQLSGSRQYTVSVSNGPTRLYVNQSATGGNNGSNWANALTDLQTALTQASAGDEIWVAKGNYSPGATASSFFTLKEGVKMYGGFAGTEILLTDRNKEAIRGANETILDGAKGIASYHVVYNTAALTAATVLDGFSIQGGKALTTYSSGSNANYYGGGIYNTAGAAVFRQLWIKNNIATYGAGLYHSGEAEYTDLIFSNNETKGSYARGAAVYNAKGFNLTKGLFEQNKIAESASYTGYGGAIFNASSSELKDVKFVSNTINSGQGGAIYSTSGAIIKITDVEFSGNKATTGGALFLYNGSLNLTAGAFKDNAATGTGGAIYSSGSAFLNQTSFVNNTAVQQGAAVWTNGIFKADNTIFSRNRVSSLSGYFGAGIYVSSGTATINNASFSGNSIGYTNASTTLSYGAAIYRNSGTVTVHNSILWGNKRGNNVADQLNAGIVIGSSIVQNNYASGTDIKIGDPMFENPLADDLRLKGGSLAINVGDNSWQTYDKDLAGNPRIVNEVVDLGAYENDGAGQLTISPGVIAAITRGTYLDLQMTYTGTSSPVTWSFQGGKLPTGLVFLPDGKLRGTPTLAGTYTFVIGAGDGTIAGNRQYTVEVKEGAVRLFVHQAATGDNNGSSWIHAFNDLQPAMAQVKAGDEIWVAKGTYSPGPTASSFFTLKEGVKLYGGFAGTEIALTDRNKEAISGVNETILDGSQGQSSYHVVYNVIALTNATILDGFSIQGGKALTTYSSGSNANYYGAGIYNTAGAALFRNLWIKNNIATYGAGLYHTGDATYSNIRFSNNQAVGSYGRGAAVYNVKGFALTSGLLEGNKIMESASYTGYGAGIFSTGLMELDSVKFINNTISNGQGGAIYTTSSAVLKLSRSEFTGNKASTGGALFIANGAPDLSDVIFHGNISTWTGGAIYAAGTPVLNRVSFLENTSGQHGAAIWSNGNIRVDNSIFSRNKINATAGYFGGAWYVSSGDALINNVSFSNNSIGYTNASTTLSYGGALYRNSGTVTVHNSILWGNKRGNNVADQLNAGIVVGSTVVQNGYATGEDVKIGDPMFENAAVDELHLKGGSLAIDAGKNSWQAFDKDLAGNPRVKNGVIDLGAFENEGGQSLIINPATIGPLKRGLYLDQQLTATGSSFPLTWALQGGKLPVGLVFGPDGKLRGTPTMIGSYTFVIGATDGTMAGNKQYTIDISTGSGRLYVHQSATGDNNGSNWANAFTDLQTAFGQSSGGDEIWVAKGTYSPGLLVSSFFTLKEGVKVYGGFAGTETLLSERDSLAIRGTNETILDGSQGKPSYHVVYNAAALTNATILDGFTIQGGNALAGYGGYYNNANYNGAGIYNTAGAAVFNHLWIKNNVASYGAGLYHSGNASYTNIIFSNNRTMGQYSRGSAVYNAGGFKLNNGVFENNKIIESASYPGYGAALFNAGLAELNNVKFNNNTITNGQGGAIYSNSGASLTITNASFTGNKSTTGGAVFIANGTPVFNDVVFKDNAATGMGGAIYASGTLSLNRTAFSGNTAVQHGGAIWSNSVFKLDNSTFSRNSVTSTAGYFGGAVYIYSGTALLTNNTFSNNSINYSKVGLLNYGGAIYRNAGTVTINNSILWGNTRGAGLADQLNLNIKVNNSLIQGGLATGINIIDRDPLFKNTTTDDLSLTGCSPAINTGDNSLVLAGNKDLGAQERTSSGIVDLGAFEYQEPVISLSPASMPQATRGDVFSLQLQGLGGAGNYSYELVSGKFPDGLSMTAGGLISGNPIVIGKYTFVVKSTDGALCGHRVYNMEIIAGTGVVRILVNQAAASGQNNGSTWDNAYLDLQSALKVALPGDQIWVAKGTYSPGPLVTSTYQLKEGVRIYGGFAATESSLSERDTLQTRTANQTILDGKNTNRHVVFNSAILTTATVLDGFTITGGKTASGSTSEPYIGAGIYNSRGAVIFNDLWIKNNNANSHGGGMYNAAAAVLNKITFENNTVTTGSYQYGGGLYNAGAAKMSNLEFLNNTAAYGAGMYQATATVTINGAIFKENKATAQGGGFYAYSGKITLNGASFIGNTSVQQGAGLFQWASTLTLSNAMFSRNKVSNPGGYFGGALYQYTGTSTLSNITVSNNSISYVNASVNKYGGGIYRNAGVMNLQNSILWGNKRGNNVSDELNLNVKVSNALIQGGYPAGKIVIDTNPMFNLTTPDDLSLSDCSAAINMGDNVFASGLNQDVLAKPRIKAETVDLGAYENQQNRTIVGPAAIPEGIRGQRYDQQLTATGGSGNYTYTVSYGKLPDGLLLSTSGRITGRPINAGIYTFNVNANDGTLCGNRLYTVEVKLGGGGVRIYVNQAATGMDNGADWTNGFLDLQKGLSSALAGDTIWVAKGKYIPGLKVNSYFTLKENVKMFGGFAGTEQELAERDEEAIATTNETVLSGENRSYHVIYNRLPLTAATVLDGFSISGGRTATGSNSSTDIYYGAGIYNATGKIVFRNLWIKNNAAYNYGGGVFNSGQAAFANIIFENNNVSAGSYGYGGGIYNSAAATFDNLKFINNKARHGGGMFNASAAINLSKVVFKDNGATINGGAFYNYTNGKPVIREARFIGNIAQQQGGAIYQQSGTLDISNTVFSRNKVTGTAAYYGGAIYHYNGITNLVNVSMANNSIAYSNTSATTQLGGALYRYTGTVNVYNTIIWGNKRGNNVPDQLSTGIIVANSTIENGYKTGVQILTKDPQFNNPSGDELSLASCSPSINMGDNTKSAGIATDLAGATRIKHGTVDIGAYEFQGLYLENAEQQLPAANQWSPYSHQIVLAENGTYTYAISQGLLPDGMSLSPQGLISGESAVAGDFEFTLSVSGTNVCGSLKIKLKVNPREPYIIEVLKPYPVPVKKDTGTPFEQLNLVTQVEVVLSDQSHAKFPVTWLPGNYDGNTEGIYTLTGTLSVPQPEMNRNNLTAIAKVAVLDPVYPYIIAMEELSPVYVLSGTPFSEVLPVLPKQVRVTYDDRVTTDMLNLVWKPGIYDLKSGVYRVYADLVLKEEHANPAGFEASVDIYAQHDVIAIEPLAEVTVPLNTPAANLPLQSSIRVTYHDQTTGFLTVIWDKSVYKSDKGAEYDLKGALQLKPLIVNSKRLFAEQKVIIRKNIISVLPLTRLTTPYATLFDDVDLPQTIKVKFDDGTTDTVGVEWKVGSYNRMLAGDYMLSGKLLHDESIDNNSNLEASLILTVLPKPKNIVSIAQPDSIRVAYGTKLTAIEALKTALAVTYDDGSTGSLNITWDTEDYDPLIPGIYTFSGDPILIEGVVNKELRSTSITITLGKKEIKMVTNPALVDVKYGTERSDINLPETVKVTYNDLSSGTEGVLWTSETYNPLLEGVYNFRGELVINDEIENPDNRYAEIQVRVGPKPLKVIAALADSVNIPFGKPFNEAVLLFPKKVNVNYDNGSSGSLNVSWTMGDYTADEPGSYELKGEIEIPEGIINPDSIKADLKVKVGKRLIKTYQAPEALTVFFGTQASELILPDALMTQLEDGGVVELGLTWDLSGYNGNLAGKYLINGSFILPDDIENPQGIVPQMELNVLAKAKAILELRTDTIFVAYGTNLTEIPFPALSHAKLDEGADLDIPVLSNSFESTDYNHQQAGTYLFEGDLVLPQGIQNPNNFPAKVCVVVGKKAIESIAAIENLNVSYGTEFDALTLPESVKVRYNDNSEDLLSVSWAKGNYNGQLPGIYVLQGTLVVPDDIDNPKALQPVMTVVLAEKIRMLMAMTMDSVSVPNGTALTAIGFPVSVTGTFDDGSTAALIVKTWGNAAYNPLESDDYIFNGLPEMPLNTQNPDNLSAAFKVKVARRYIVSVASLPGLLVPNGTLYVNLALPTTVNVTYNNNQTEPLSLIWEEGTFDGTTAGDYLLTGTLMPDAPEENKDNKTAAIKVTVQPALLIINTVTVSSPVHFPLGTSLSQVITQLGLQLPVAYTNGSSGLAGVNWESADFVDNQVGSFNFTGLLDPEEKASNPNDITAKVVVIIDKKNIVSVEEPAALTDVYGKLFSALDLPSTVKVTYDDGTKEDLPVLWDETGYQSNVLQPQLIKGEIQLTDEVSNTSDLRASIKVTLMKDIVSLATIAPIAVNYGTPFSGLGLPLLIEATYNDGSKENLSVTWDPAVYAAAPVGELIMTGDLTLAPNTFNTTLQAAAATVNIRKAPQVISFSPIVDKVYGDDPFKLLATVASGLPITFELIEGHVDINADIVHIEGAGEVLIKAVQLGNAYFEKAEAQQNFKISKALLTVYGDSLKRFFGQENPTFSHEMKGFKYGETETGLRAVAKIQGMPAYNTTATISSLPGTYPVVLSLAELQADNYDFSFEPGLLTIVRQFHTLTWDTRGGTLIAPMEVEDQAIVTPQLSTKEGTVFYAWYSDQSMETVFNFGLPVTESVTLYADWKKSPLPASGPISMKTVADYMLAIGEIRTEERNAPFGISFLNQKSHLEDKMPPFKLTEWYGYGEQKKPLLKTVAVTQKSTTSVFTGIDLLDDGGPAILESGVCWSTSPGPTIADQKLTSGTGSSVLSPEGLNTGVPYYLKAYATNRLGTAYGNELVFIIKEDGLIEIVKK
ncbi:putative Ig domain-containing protein [Pedobacter sp. FW305-3-2-15-E-R2A2]|uniref:putative Ig domain-containing protein n=1 Tax=Pedobacter sp. FW305-3-2-15-E-R2A2 TaxID=3140251 RepID=UPI00314066C5